MPAAGTEQGTWNAPVCALPCGWTAGRQTAGRRPASHQVMAPASIPRFRRFTAFAAASGALLLLAGCGSTVTQTEKAWGPIYTAKPQRLTPANRKAINHALDVFVRDGVERGSPARALSVASPMMRSGGTRSQWLAGELPVPPFQAAGKRFHGYTVVTATPTQANLTVILQPKHPRTDGAIAYNVRVSKIHGRWMLDWFTPVAFFAPSSKTPGITAEPDLAPGPANDLQPKSHGTLIFEGVFALLLMPAFVAIGVIVVYFVRERRRVRPSTEDERWASALRAPTGTAEKS